MKKFGFLLCLLFLSCSSNEFKKNNSNQENINSDSVKVMDKKLNPQEEKVIYNKLLNEYKTLYLELMDFKIKKDFHSQGFGIGSQYKKWWDRVQLLTNEPEIKLLVKKGIIPGELQTLGNEYLQSQGKETEYSTFINSEIKRIIKD
jgi:hypothetical protein